MIHRIRNRQGILGSFAASGLLLAAFAMPKVAIHDPSMLYVVGQIRMAVGDSEGGFRFLSRAAAERDAKTRESAPAEIQQPKQKLIQNCSAERPKSMTKSNGRDVKTVAMAQSTRNSAMRNLPSVAVASVPAAAFKFEALKKANAALVAEPKLVQVASLRIPDDALIQMQAAKAAQEQVLIERNQARAQRALIKVRHEFERRNMPVPADVLVALEAPPFVR